MSSASSRAESGNIIYGNADGSSTWNGMIVAAVVIIVALVALFLFKDKK
jgi:hypothetical protein